MHVFTYILIHSVSTSSFFFVFIYLILVNLFIFIYNCNEIKIELSGKWLSLKYFNRVVVKPMWKIRLQIRMSFINRLLRYLRAYHRFVLLIPYSRILYDTCLISYKEKTFTYSTVVNSNTHSWYAVWR